MEKKTRGRPKKIVEKKEESAPVSFYDRQSTLRTWVLQDLKVKFTHMKELHYHMAGMLQGMERLITDEK